MLPQVTLKLFYAILLITSDESGTVGPSEEPRVPSIPEDGVISTAPNEPSQAAPADPASAPSDPTTQGTEVMTEEDAERVLQQSETIATTPIDPGNLKTVVDIQNSFQVSVVCLKVSRLVGKKYCSTHNFNVK